MPILAAELVFYKPQTVSEGASNGGRMSASSIASGAVGAIFPAVGESERTAGSTKSRKVFCKNANADGLALTFAKIFLDKYTPGDDIMTFRAASQVNTQSQIDAAMKKHGCGKLDANAIATATEIDVLVEDGTDHTFEDGDEIRIADKENVADVGGTEEFIKIVGTPTVDGDVVTITFAPALANGYSASDARVMNVYEPFGTKDVASLTRSGGTATATTETPHNLFTGDTVAVAGAAQGDYNGTFEVTVTSPVAFTYAVANAPATPATGTITCARDPASLAAYVTDVEVTSALGTFDAENALGDNVGGVQQVVTATFTSPTTFDLVGDTLGALGSGSIGAGAAPNNPDFGAPFFTLEAAGFGGTFAEGDVITFTTIPSSVPLFLERGVPAGAAALSPNSALLQFRGETA